MTTDDQQSAEGLRNVAYVPSAVGTPSRPTHLKRLTVLRAVAALFVFANHLGLRGGTVGAGRYVVDYGYTGVAFFFVLSGFVLTWSAQVDDSRTAFYIRRFARIYPSHLVMLMVAILVPVTISTVTLRDTGINAALLQSWLPGRSHPYSLNGVSWSLSCEVAFYAVLPVILPWALTLRPRTRWILSLTYWASSSVVTVAVSAMRHGQDAAYVFPPLRAGEFFLGVVAALEVRRGWYVSQRWTTGLMAVGLILMGGAWNRFPAADVGAGILFLAVVVLMAQQDLARPVTWLTQRWFVYAGQVSFAFYLVHELVIINLVGATGLRGWWLDLCALPASCAAAALLHHCVERPCEKRLRRLKVAGQPGARAGDRPSPFSG